MNPQYYQRAGSRNGIQGSQKTPIRSPMLGRPTSQNQSWLTGIPMNNPVVGIHSSNITSYDVGNSPTQQYGNKGQTTVMEQLKNELLINNL